MTILRRLFRAVFLAGRTVIGEAKGTEPPWHEQDAPKDGVRVKCCVYRLSLEP